MRFLRAARFCVAVGAVIGITTAFTVAPNAATAAAGGTGLVDSVTPLSNGFLKHVYYQNGKEVARLVAVAGATLKISYYRGALTASVVEPPETEPTTDEEVAHAQARLMGYGIDDWTKVMREPDAGSMPNGRPNLAPVQVRTLQPLADTDAAVISNTPPCWADVLEITGWDLGEAHSGWERWCLTDSDPSHRYSIENNHVTAWAKTWRPLVEVRLGNYYEWGVPYQWNPGSTYTTGSCHTGFFEMNGGIPIANVTVHTDFNFCPDRVKFASADQTTPNTHMTGAWEGAAAKDSPIELVVQTKEYVANDKFANPWSQLYLRVY